MKRLLAGPRRTFAAATALFALLLVNRAHAQTTTPSQPPAKYSPNGFQVHVDSDSGLSVFKATNDLTMVPVRVGRFGTRLETSHVFAPVCPGVGGCDTRFQMGEHALALRNSDGTLIQGNSVLVDQPVNIYGELVDRSALRSVGVAGLVTSAVAGVALIATIPSSDWQTCSGSCPLQLALGLSVLTAGTLVFTALAMTGDGASFSITPLVLRPTASRESSGSASVVPNGAALTFRF